jgi:hypothetical protein
MPVTAGTGGEPTGSSGIRPQQAGPLCMPGSYHQEKSEWLNLGLPGTDPDRLLYRYDEDLPIADLPGAGGFGDR